MPKRFKYTPQTTLPKLGTIKTEWDLKNLYYTSERDPRIEADIKATERAYKKFAKKWSQSDFTASAAKLAAALTEYETLVGMPEASRPGRYFSFRLALDANDAVAQKQQALLVRRLRPVSNLVLFFTLEIGLIPKAKQKNLLENPKLAHFRYFLQRTFLGAAYNLTEAEEKIISLKSSQSYGMWVSAVDKIVSNRQVDLNGTQVAVPEAMETLDLLPAKQKKKLWSNIMQEMEQISEVAEHEFNAILTDVRTEEDLRGYKKPYSSTALGYEDSEKSIENLVEAVSDKGFKLSKKFYKLKAQYHGVSQLHYTQKYDSIGVAPTIDFAQAVEIARDVFYGVKTEYGSIFDRMLERGQIDVYPKPGKRGGAFMSDATNHPTHVFLNHTNNFKSLETLAHEMGHAIHAHRSGTQTSLYDGHSITTAETASTLFENLLFDAVYSQADIKTQSVLLHDRIARDIATIQRQIACFNCELEYHNTITVQGSMTREELRAVMQKHLQAYVGPGVAVEPRDGYSYVYWSHLRYGFYVYTYTFGILMSTIMANNYKADQGYIEEIDKFLCAGASDTVANIFKSIGINTGRPDTFTKALDNHAADIAAFAKLVKAKG